eukprot:scaffold1928_cov381-Prasinococcus_capsulatus_cf.AAC.16
MRGRLVHVRWLRRCLCYLVRRWTRSLRVPGPLLQQDRVEREQTRNRISALYAEVGTPERVTTHTHGGGRRFSARRVAEENAVKSKHKDGV